MSTSEVNLKLWKRATAQLRSDVHEELLNCPLLRNATFEAMTPNIWEIVGLIPRWPN